MGEGEVDWELYDGIWEGGDRKTSRYALARESKDSKPLAKLLNKFLHTN